MKRLFKCVVLIAALVMRMLDYSAQVIEPKHTFNVELGLPNGFTNEPFKNIMQGLVNFSTYYQYDFKNHLTAGAGIRYGYFAINEFKVPKPVYGGMHSTGAFLKVGWEKFINDRFAIDLGVKVGYSQHYFDTDRNDSAGNNPIQLNSFYVDPTMGLILTADEVSSYRLFFSYASYGFGFKPSMIGLETFGGYDPSGFNKVTGFLIVGFGYTFYFKSK
ncbi:MAG: hypothetical protein ACK50Y_02720 [Flavobacteriia bacterium]